MEKSPPQYDTCRQDIEDKLLVLQLSLSNNEEIDYEDLRQMLTQIITPAASDVRAHQQNQELILDTPFKWKPISEKNSPAERIKGVLEKKKGYKNESDSQWSIIVLNLVLCYEYMIHEDDRAAASALMDECDAILADCVDPEDFVGANQSVFHRVVDSTRYHVSADAAERSSLLAGLRPHAELTTAEVAAVWGLRGAVHMEYGYTGNKLAEMYLHTAIKFEPNVAQWHFLYGQCLGRLRHINFNLNLPRDVELVSLERAVELSKNPYFVAYLAQAYREAASSLFWQRSASSKQLGDDLAKTAKRMNARAAQLYEEALALRPYCPYVNVRCAQGFMRFHGEQRDYQRAYECCRQAVEMCPTNTMINHVWGQINERMGNYKIACKHLRIAAYQGAFGACMDLVRLSLRNNKQYDPCPLFQDMLKRFPEDPYQIEVNVQMGMYHYVVKRDTPTAVDYIMRGVDIDPLSDKLKSHRSVFSKVRDCNIYSVLLEAADGVASEDERRAKFGRVMSICRANFPELLENRSPLIETHFKMPAVPQTRQPPQQGRTATRGNWRSDQQGDGNWRRNQQGDGSWRRNNVGDGGSTMMYNWRDPKARAASTGGNFQENRRQGDGKYRAYTRSEGSTWGHRSDYGSDRSDAGSIAEEEGSGYDSGMGSHSPNSVRSCNVRRLADRLATQGLADGAGDRAARGATSRAKV